ncbi:hypothetical protein [Terricaulis sp.]|uniref:hypothetical protein n=1 Tax=Terricaulis sp. TaxID=2768686 RepID=UPI00378362C2
MRNLVFGLLAAVLTLCLEPRAAAQTVGGPIQVRTGDVFTVSVEYTQTSEVAAQNYEIRMSQVYEVRVLDAEDRLWRFLPVSLSYEIPHLPGVEGETASAINWPAMSDAMSAMLRMATDVGFDCRVNEYGRCMDMTNWPFWSARVENFVLMADGIARAMPRSATTPDPMPTPAAPHSKGLDEGEGAPVATPSWETLRQPVLQSVSRVIDAFDSRDAAAGMSWVYPPAFVQGRTLTRRQTVSFVDEYDMPFGAPPLRYNGTMRLDRVNTRDNTAIVVRQSRLDPESARAALRSMTEFVSENVIQPLAPYYPGGEEPPAGAELARMLDAMLGDVAYEENTRAVIDLSTGLAREATTDFSVSARMTGTETPFTTRGRFVTRVAAGPPQVPRLPRDR